MLDPYRMVAVNLIASAILFIGLLFYIYIYPKRKINLLLQLFLISILPLLSLLRQGDYESGDFNIHIYRMMAFYDSLSEGHFMPSWAGELNATYGNPLFIFNYPLPYYVISFFHLIGFSFIDGTKIYLGLTFLLSGIFMYIFVRKLTGSQFAAFTSSIFYLFNPYHLIDMHFRATLGESTIFMLAPLLLYCVYSYLKGKKFIYLISSGLIGQLLFLAHPMIAGIFIGISALFAIFIRNIKKNFSNIFLLISFLVIGSIGALYSWFSFILYSQYMFPNQKNIVFQDTFSKLFFSPWRLGLLFQGPNGELAPIIGYTQIIVVIIATILLIKKNIIKKFRSYCIFWLLIFSLILFFMSPYSRIIWAQFPSLSMFQSNRLLLPIALCTSLLAGYLVIILPNILKKKILIYVFIFITIGYTILNWGHRRVIPQINDNTLRKNVWKSTLIEGTTAYFLNNKWADINNFWFSKLPKQHLEIIQGKGIIREIKRKSTLHSYVLDANTPVTVEENTLYYPGWKLKNNYNNVVIYPGERGIINAKLPQGLQYIELGYSDIFPYKISKIISVFITFVLLNMFMFFILPIERKK